MKVDLASLNVQGMNVVMKTEEVEAWMKEHGIHIMAIWETHIPETKVERQAACLRGIMLARG